MSGPDDQNGGAAPAAGGEPEETGARRRDTDVLDAGAPGTAPRDDVADRAVSPGPGPVEPPPAIVAEGPSLEHDLGLLRPLAGWDAVVSRLARTHLVGALAVVWWLASTMLAQLEDQLEIMHLAGDRAFSLAALDDAGATLPGVLATWRRWQLGTGPSFVVGPGSIITNELALNLVLPLATATLLAVAARWAWSGCELGFRRDIAATAVVAAPLGLAAAYLRNAAIAAVVSGGLDLLGAFHLFLALSVLGISAAIAWRWWRPDPRVPAGGVAVAVITGAGLVTLAVARLYPPCSLAERCGTDPGPVAVAGLSISALAVRLLTFGIVAAVALASVYRARDWATGGGPRRVLQAGLAVRGQLIAVLPVVALPLMGNSDLGLQVQNALSRLLESATRTVLLLLGVVAVMITLAAFGQRSARSAAKPRPGPASPPVPAGPRDAFAALPKPWRVWTTAVVAFAVFGALRVLSPAAYGLQAAAFVLGVGALLSAPTRVAHLRRGQPILTDTGPEVLVARALVVSAVPLALASLAARQAVTPSTGVLEAAAAAVMIVLACLAVAVYQQRRPLARRYAGRPGLVAVAASTVVTAVLAVWGAWRPVSFGFVFGSMLTFLTVVGVLAVLAGWLVLAGNHLPARGALAAAGFRRVPVLLVVVAVVFVGSRLDPAPAYHDVRVEAGPNAEAGTNRNRSVALAAAFGQWADGAAKPPAGTAGQRVPVPMVFVATAGGGIKAAYWTTLVLGCLQEGADAGPRCPPGRTVDRSNIFLASGISGGSLGLAVDHARYAGAGGPVPGYEAMLDTGLAADFLAPDIAALVLRDGPSALLHTTAWTDRAAVLEDAWAQGFTDAGGAAPGLDGRFLAGAAPDSGPTRFPLLLLNSATIEDRCRLAVTPLDLSPPAEGRSCVADPFRTGAQADSVVSRTKEITDYVCPGQDLRLSTAALLSARFPFVSPYGQLNPCRDATDAPSLPTSFAVDGGLVESSAAGPVPDVLNALEPEIAAWEARAGNEGYCIAPRLVTIDHGYGLDTRGDPPPVPGQLRAPTAFFSADSAVSAAAQQQAAMAFTAYQREHGCGGGDDPVAAFALTLHPGQRAPLGWTLSEAARDEMTGQLKSDPNRCRLVAVRQWFAGIATTTAGGPTEGCVAGTLPVMGGRPEDVQGAQVILWRRAAGDPAAPAERVGSTVADVSGRFDLPAPVIGLSTYSLCYQPGEGASAVSRLGERLPDDASAGPARTPLTLTTDRLTRIGTGDTVARC
jgi:hypothetical protein